MNKSKYFIAQDYYRKKLPPEQIKWKIEEYLQEKVDGKPVGIDAKEILILAKVNLKLGEIEEAERLLKICMNLDPKNIPARTELGRLYASQGRAEEAEQLFKEVLIINPKDIPARTELGRLYASQGKAEEAEQLFKEAIEIDPKNIPPRTELGRLYASQGRAEEAEQLFREVLIINPKDIPARTELERLYELQVRNKLNDARKKVQAGNITLDDIDTLKKSAGTKDGEDKYKLQLAIVACYERIGNKKAALQYLSEIEDNSDNHRCLNKIKQSLQAKKVAFFDLGKWDELIGWEIDSEEEIISEQNSSERLQITTETETQQEQQEPKIDEVTESSQIDENAKLISVMPMEMIYAVKEIQEKGEQNAETVKKIGNLLNQDATNERALADFCLTMIENGYENMIRFFFYDKYQIIMEAIDSCKENIAKKEGKEGQEPDNR